MMLAVVEEAEAEVRDAVEEREPSHLLCRQTPSAVCSGICNHSSMVTVATKYSGIQGPRK